MGTSAAKSSSNEEFYTRYDPLPGIKAPHPPPSPSTLALGAVDDDAE